LNELTK